MILFFLLPLILLTIAAVNFVQIRTPRHTSELLETVGVIVPMRNEAENVEGLVATLAAQEGSFHFYLLDDNSEDQTFELLHRFTDGDSRFTVLKGAALDDKWIGKTWALQQLYEASQEEVLVSLDADVRLSNDALNKAVTTLHGARLDFVSPYPRQIAQSFAERLIQPLLQWSWMSTVLLRGAEKFPMQSTVICNGQFLAMKGSSLKAIGGFESVAHKVLDDIELGRSFVAAGFRGSVIDGSEISSTRMYSSFAEIKSGYGKSLHTAFGSIVGSIFAALFIAATGILPLLYSLDGNLLAIAALLAIIGTRFVSAAASSTRLRDSILHPLSSALFIYLLYFSWRNRGKTQWKGRTL